MSGHPVPSRENHRDSRGAKVHPKSVTCKPWKKKFSTTFSTTRHLTLCKKLMLNESEIIQKLVHVL